MIFHPITTQFEVDSENLKENKIDRNIWKTNSQVKTFFVNFNVCNKAGINIFIFYSFLHASSASFSLRSLVTSNILCLIGCVGSRLLNPAQLLRPNPVFLFFLKYFLIAILEHRILIDPPTNQMNVLYDN